jgi:hypothetical protein
MGVYSPFRMDLSTPKKNYSSTYPILADIEDDIEDSADQRRLSNASLGRSEHISKEITKITDISDEDNAEPICESSLFKFIKDSSWISHLGHTARVSSICDGKSQGAV